MLKRKFLFIPITKKDKNLFFCFDSIIDYIWNESLNLSDSRK